MIILALAATLTVADLNDVLKTNFPVTTYKDARAAMSEYAKVPGGYQHHACTISQKARDASYELKALKIKNDFAADGAKQLELEILQADRDADYYASICTRRR